jgi:hypothetical protein
MTSPDGASSLFVAHDLDDMGRSVVRSMLGTRPFEAIGGMCSLPVSGTDDRPELAAVMLAGLADMMDLDEDADHTSIAVSWDRGPKVSCSRSDASLPWPVPTDGMIARLESIGPSHRLVPTFLMPAVRGMLPDERISDWSDADGLVLSAEMAYETDTTDALGRLRTMAACAEARTRGGFVAGSMIREGSRTDGRG